MPNLDDARKRSVDNLQRLYTVVVSLAITESLRRMLGGYNVTGTVAGHKEWFMFVSLIVTVIPFYHGANRYLDATFVTGERSAKRYALLVDFFFLFFEGLLFFGLAMVTANESLYYTVLSGLLLLDIIWVGVTNFTASSEEDKMPDYNTWAAINFIAMVALLVSTWSTLLNFSLWKTEFVTSLALMLIAIARTVFDYIRVYRFYYPADEDQKANNMPAPPPAPLPHAQARG